MFLWKGGDGIIIVGVKGWTIDDQRVELEYVTRLFKKTLQD